MTESTENRQLTIHNPQPTTDNRQPKSVKSGVLVVKKGLFASPSTTIMFLFRILLNKKLRMPQKNLLSNLKLKMTWQKLNTTISLIP
ncbi:hypothetical protein [Flavobacterium acetivorans]|uniref:hypothetical protein n=1 Tax=Flavobacterium acetivorans TaxID=2893883 RepID=UPI001E3AC898|nr:hypothetical protein [Flavobacterium sp. F-29]UFH36527.1 hypothetical protein LNP19_05660 [Flavobacterium sp. F-29]